MADIPRGNRPLSPHLTVYRPQWTSMTSIFTRITGNGLIVAVVLVVWWLLAASVGPEAFAVADGVIRSWFGDLVLLASTWALWYHSLSGLRHIVWDSGFMLEIHRAERAGMAIVAGSFGLTILTVLILWWL